MSAILHFARGIMVSAVSGPPPPPAYPGTPEIILCLDYGPSVLNAGGLPCGFEKIAAITDLTGQRTVLQASSGSQALYLPADGGYLWVPQNNISAAGAYVDYHVSTRLQTQFVIEFMLRPRTLTGGIRAAFSMTDGGALSWDCVQTAAGKILWKWWTPSNVLNQAESTVALPIADLGAIHVRIFYTKNTGGGNYAVVFETSADGLTWSALGSTVAGASTADIQYGTQRVELGGHASVSSSQYLDGALYYLKMRTGTPSSGTDVWHWKANDSGHLAQTGTESVNSLPITYYAKGALLIKKGTAWSPPGASYAISSVISVPGDFRAASLSGGCADIYNQAIAGGSSSSAGPFHGYQVNRTLYSGNNANYFLKANGVVQYMPYRTAHVADYAGVSCTHSVNGTLYSGIAPVSFGTGSGFSKFFSWGSINGSGGITRFGIWKTGTLPSVATLEAWLEA